jgi:hypothetical protein
MMLMICVFQSLLSMPLLDWSADHVVTSHFWVYWVITIPVTLLTMFAIGLWIIIQAKRAEATSKAARDAVGGNMSESNATSSLWESSVFEGTWKLSRIVRLLKVRRWYRETRMYGMTRTGATSSSGSDSRGSLVDD